MAEGDQRRRVEARVTCPHDAMLSPRKRAAARLLNSIAEKDEEMARGVIARDVVWWPPPSVEERGIARPIVGREPVIELICGPSRYRPESMRWTVQRFLEESDAVAVHCTLDASTAAGVPYRNEYVQVMRFVGADVAEFWEHTDTAYAFARYDEGERFDDEP